MAIDNMITGFISDFKKRNRFALEDTFTNGYCYYFAIILKERFKDYGGEIYYNQVDNHFAYCLNMKLYDVNGQIIDSEKYKYISWEVYKLAEPLDSSRVDRDCIKKYVSIKDVDQNLNNNVKQTFTNYNQQQTCQLDDIPFK